MRGITAVLVTGFVVWGAAAADEADLLNAATLDALDAAKASLAQASKVEGVTRVGVATLENDPGNVTALVQSMLTKTAFDVVLTSDVDWGPLADEFVRQVKREDIILQETAHELRVQGVDALLFGTVEKADVEAIQESGQEGQRATVRLMLNLASLAEENPGSLLWSEQVEGAVEELTPLAPADRVAVFIVSHRFALIVLGAFLVFLLVVAAYRRAATPR